MRSTVHLHTAKDLLALRATIAPAIEAANPRRRARAGGAEVDMEAVVEEGERLFAKGEALTAKQLRDALEKAPPRARTSARSPWSCERIWRWCACPTAAGGASRPRRPSPRWRPGSASRRPSAPTSRSWWSATWARSARPRWPTPSSGWAPRGLAPAFEKLDLKRFEDENGRELFDLPDAPRPAEDTPAPVRFLPEFDSLMLAHKDRTRVISDEHRKGLTTKNLRVRATVLVDGRVAAFWKLEKKSGTATVVVEPLVRIKKADRAEIEAEGEALARFLEPGAKRHVVKLSAGVKP